MISWEQCGLIILASGQSTRFGETDKLTAPFRGRPLAAHAAQLATAAPFAKSISVIPADRPALNEIFQSVGATIVTNDNPDAGQGRSLSLGVKALCDQGCDAAFVVLADMPLVRLAHLDRLRQKIGAQDAIFASHGERRSPPSLLRKSTFPFLAELEGDHGAKAALGDFITGDIGLPREGLADIDTIDDLHRLEESAETGR